MVLLDKKITKNGEKQKHFSSDRQTTVASSCIAFVGKTLKFEYWYGPKLCTRVFVDYAEQSVKVINFTDDIILQAFGRRKITIGTIDEFFRERVFPETRVNCKELLRQMGFRNYDAESIARKTHGILYNGLFWLRFGGEDLTWADIKALRKEAGFHV
ncbi:MAG: hypothetical protein HFH68_01525 [Lachnospiraceae bacterium]|nr:hypothetical protein [Lachnospiraceae bacterium]